MNKNSKTTNKIQTDFERDKNHHKIEKEEWLAQRTELEQEISKNIELKQQLEDKEKEFEEKIKGNFINAISNYVISQFSIKTLLIIKNI